LTRDWRHLNSGTLIGIGESADSDTRMNKLYYGDNLTVLDSIAGIASGDEDEESEEDDEDGEDDQD
jgi:hypothetical protein